MSDRPAPCDSASGAPTVLGYDRFEVLGRGSMGVVYKARQTALGRHVALKMIRADPHCGREQVERFTVEARALASVQHPNIVQIYEINLEHEPPYFSMELVEGGTLADRLGSHPQPARAAAQLVLTLARAIHVAHQNGIVHRDLKPGNVLIPSADRRGSALRMTSELGLLPHDLGQGTAKITDFGLAKNLHADASQTESGVIMGTPSYMSPEQAEGKSREVGPAADIYALGAILYEMLTGRPPFTAESPMETFLLLFNAEPVHPSQLQPKTPRDLETICLKCLHKTPSRRYASAEALADDLQLFLSGEPILARPASRCEQVGKWARRRPALAASAACSLLALTLLMGLGLWYQVDIQDRLGQALQAERDSRGAEVAAAERERLGLLRDKLKDLVHAAEGAVAANDWHGARVQLARAREQVADEPELADLRARVESLQQRTDRQRHDHERLDKFLDRRNEALFHATLFTGGSLASDGRETRAAATEALAQFGGLPGSATGPALDSSFYTDRQKAEVTEASYELFLVLADSVAQPLPGQSADDQRRQAEEAVRVLDRATGLGITTQAYHRRRAQSLAQAGQVQAAQEERERAGALSPSTPLDYFLAGQEQYRGGDCKLAVAAFESALQLRPDHFWARYYLALSWLKTQRPEQAVTCLTSCLAQRREFPWLYLLRATAWGELGQYARAEADFESASQGPLPDAARYGLLINRGVMRVRQGRLDGAGADLREAIALRPQQYHGYLNLAQSQLKDGRWDDALGQLDRAVQLEPGLASLYRTRARLHLLRQEPEAALADFDEAVRREPNPALPAAADDHLDRGRILYARKDFVGALAAADAAAVVRPRDARACRLRAEALVGLDRPPDALRALDDCLTYGPPDPGAFRARAALRTKLGQYPGAQTDYTRALDLDPDAATYTARGWCYLVAGAPRLALPDFDEAVRLAPELADAYAGRGYGRAILGQPHPAVADADEAMKRGPQSPRLCYKAARVYAQAIAHLDRLEVYVGVGADSPRRDWEDRAVRALAQALDQQPPAEAATFWQTVIGTDGALDPIRRGSGFGRLAGGYPALQSGMTRRD